MMTDIICGASCEKGLSNIYRLSGYKSEIHCFSVIQSLIDLSADSVGLRSDSADVHTDLELHCQHYVQKPFLECHVTYHITTADSFKIG